jgi:hypothetical protein
MRFVLVVLVLLLFVSACVGTPPPLVRQKLRALKEKKRGVTDAVAAINFVRYWQDAPSLSSPDVRPISVLGDADALAAEEQRLDDEMARLQGILDGQKRKGSSSAAAPQRPTSYLKPSFAFELAMLEAQQAAAVGATEQENNDEMN